MLKPASNNLSTNILDAINQVFARAFKCKNEEDLAKTCLQVAEELTGSRFGWIGEMNTDGRLDTIAISDPGWSACRMHQTEAVPLIRGMMLKGIWSRVIKDGVPLLTNSPAAHPDWIGLPKDHPPLESFLGIPLKEGNRIAGMISLGNKPGGFTGHDLQAVETLSAAIHEALMRKRAEINLHQAYQQLEKKVDQRTAELEKEKKFSEDALNSMPGVFYLFGDQLRFQRWNKNFETVTGYSSAEVAALSPLDLFDESDRTRVAERIMEVFEKGASYVEADFLTKSGQKIPHFFTGNQTMIDGKTFLIGVGIDTSELKASEHRREQLLLDMAERVKELQCMYTITDIVRTRETIPEMLEHTVAVIPSGWQYPEITAACIRFDDNLYGSGDLADSPWKLSSRIYVDGASRGSVDVMLTGTPPKDPEIPFLDEERALLDNIARLMGDAIKRHILERTLKQNEERFRAIYELGLVGLAITSPDKGWIMANDQLCDTLGYPIEELKTKTWAELTHPDDLAADVEQFDKLLAGDIDGYSLEKRFIRKAGEVVHTNLVVRCVRNENQSIDYVIAMVEDITDKKLADIKLRETLKNLERSNRELEQFAYVASHDLQEPLRMVASYVQLLERRYKDKLDDSARDFINYAVDGANRMKTLINDLLAYSRVETRGKPHERTDMSLVLGETIVSLKTMIEENQAIITNDELPDVWGDKGQIRQLLQNLIANAIKFSGENLPHVHLSAKEIEAEWVFSVKDNGIGIDPQFFDRIFTIFQRLHAKGDYTGTGIGLSICKRIVERHGGRIWLTSEPGKGSTFYFTVPREGMKN